MDFIFHKIIVTVPIQQCFKLRVDRENAPVIGYEPITGHSIVFYCLQKMKTIEYNGVAGYWFMADYWCIYPIDLVI